MKKLFILSLALLPFVVLHAENPEHVADHPHELRIGIGDPIMHLYKDNGILLKDGAVYHPTDRKAHSVAHVFAEYNYRFGKHFCIGVQFDFVPVFGADYIDVEIPAGTKEQMLWHQYYFNIMPTFKCHYLDREMISLYSGLGLGLSYAKYSSVITWDLEYFMSHTPVENIYGAAVDITAIGISVGKDHWFGDFELGALLDIETGIRNRIIPSRFLSASVGYRF